MKTIKLYDMSLSKVVKACLVHANCMKNPYINNKKLKLHSELNKVCVSVAKSKYEMLNESDKKIINPDGRGIVLSRLFCSGL